MTARASGSPRSLACRRVGARDRAAARRSRARASRCRVALAAFVAGLVAGARRGADRPTGRGSPASRSSARRAARSAGLQPDSARLRRRSTSSSWSPACGWTARPALLVAGGTLAAEVLVLGARPRRLRGAHRRAAVLRPAVVPRDAAAARAARGARHRRGDRRGAAGVARRHAEAAALAERGRVARDMHDVLAHSLSALSLQLEGARLLARDRGADPEVVGRSSARTTSPRAGWPRRARRSARCAATRCPGRSACARWRRASPATRELASRASRGALASEARLAVYRTAQEALTNVRRHSAADRVEVRLAYEPDGTRARRPGLRAPGVAR